MKLALASITVAAGLFASAGAFAQVPAGAPAGTTGICKDGTYSSADTKKGACRGHKGVKDWYVAAAPATAASATPAPMAAAPAAPAAPTPAAKPATAAAAKTAAPGGGPGQVWVNTKTKVYHCSTDKSYGKTKEGEYMTEPAAKAAGDRPSHGKACAV